MSNKYATPAQLRAKAAEMELEAANFLTKKGEYAKRQKKVHRAEFKFIDGSVMIIRKKDLDAINEIEFSLRPSVPDA